ncbi:MAG: ATP-binding protein, partial [Thermodesulfobacteriota bacterium]
MSPWFWKAEAFCCIASCSSNTGNELPVPPTVEHIGSGIKRIRNLCREYGVDEPLIEVSEHWFTVIFPRPKVESEEAVAADTPEVTPEVQSMLFVFDGEMPRRDIMGALGLSDEKHFREHYQQT